MDPGEQTQILYGGSFRLVHSLKLEIGRTEIFSNSSAVISSLGEWAHHLVFGSGQPTLAYCISF